MIDGLGGNPRRLGPLGKHESIANPGKRGSRRLYGDHVLTQQDLMSARFADDVAIGGWPMDDHPPGGFDRPDLPPNVAVQPKEVYNIPLRSLYSKDVNRAFQAMRDLHTGIVYVNAPTIGAENASDQPLAWNSGTTGITTSREVCPSMSALHAIIECRMLERCE